MRYTKYILLMAFIFRMSTGNGQTGTGSSAADNSSVEIEAGTIKTELGESCYFGPEANWTINGTLEIYSTNIWIAPGAIIKGTGKIVVYGPGENPFYIDMAEGPTYIDGNQGPLIKLLLEHRNTRNITLKDVDDPGYGTTNPSIAGASLNMDGELKLAGDGANIILNGNNLFLGSNATITGYGVDRMVVTDNSIDGHLMKQFPDAGSFVFPVGIAAADYTPATVAVRSAGTVSVSVEDYARSGLPGIKPNTGMDRNWHIYANTPLRADVTLQHNQVTNGSLFRDAGAGIAQYKGFNNWDIAKGLNPGLGIHTRLNMDLAENGNSFNAWITKYTVSGSTLTVPNLYTPNGDGINDAFIIRGLELFAENDIVIVNRWGNEVFRATNYRNNWTGQGLNEGTYFYVLRVKETTNADWQIFKGYITLLRTFKR
jgi:gliding motility-associated-like protein